MGVTRRKFTLEFKTEAAHRVIDTGRIDCRGVRRAVGGGQLVGQMGAR